MSDRKAIFITGGGSGIGRAVALHFAERGWFVGLGDIDKTGLHETAELIGNGFVYTHLHDVRDRTAWDEALEAFSVATGGRIDVLFNNAGIPLGGSLIENSPEEIERCLDINLKGVLFGAQAAYPYLQEDRPGRACSTLRALPASMERPGRQRLFGDQVRRSRHNRKPRWRMGGRRDQCAFAHAQLHRHAAARSQSQRPVERRHPPARDRCRARDHAGRRTWQRRHGPRCMAKGCTPPSARPPKRMAFAARWLPGRVRKQTRAGGRPMGEIPKVRAARRSCAPSSRRAARDHLHHAWSA